MPADVNIIDTEREKILKYVDLQLELQKIWNLRCIKFIPIVLGSFTPNLPKNLELLPGVHKIGSLLKAALLGSAHLMRRSLIDIAIPGDSCLLAENILNILT